MDYPPNDAEPQSQKPRANKSLHPNEAPSLRSSASRVSLAFDDINRPLFQRANSMKRKLPTLQHLTLLLAGSLSVLAGCATAQDAKATTNSSPRAASPSAEAKPASEVEWKAAEKKFLALLGIADFEKTFTREFFEREFGPMAIADEFSRITDARGQCVGVIWKPREAHLEKLTLEEIRKKCGTASHSYGPKEEMWGRVGFVSKDGHSDFVFQVVPSISNLKKPEK